MATTDTPTTGGLDTIFNQKALGLDATTILVLSVAWSLNSIIMLHLKAVKIEKGCLGTKAKMSVWFWGVFATLRRILTITSVFTPCLGLFSLLNHHQLEQIPYRVRLDYAKKFPISPETDKIALHGLNSTVLWSELDHFDYSTPEQPTPPPYSNYTLLSLGDTFKAFICLSIVQFFSILIVKAVTSAEFRAEKKLINKFVHLIHNLHYATPFEDWDSGIHSVSEYRARYRNTCREMTWTFITNMVFSFIMMVPLWYAGE